MLSTSYLVRGIIVTNYFFSFNQQYRFNLCHDKIIVNSRYENEQIVLHGELTSKVLIPLFPKLSRPLSMETVMGQTACSYEQVNKLFQTLCARNIFIRQEASYFTDTGNHISNYLSTKENFRIIIVADFYMSQFEFFNQSLLVDNNVSIEYIFYNMDSAMFENVSKVINEKTEQNKKVTVKYAPNEEIIERLLTEDSGNLLIEIQYEQIYDSYQLTTQLQLNEYCEKHQLSVIFLSLSANSFLIGPFYIPKKTASFSDFLENKVDVPKEEPSNFFVNAMLAESAIGIITNEVNWFLYRSTSPILLNHVVYSSNLLLENNRLNIFFYN